VIRTREPKKITNLRVTLIFATLEGKPFAIFILTFLGEPMIMSAWTRTSVDARTVSGWVEIDWCHGSLFVVPKPSSQVVANNCGPKVLPGTLESLFRPVLARHGPARFV
jgi:hypothetical protein